VDIIGGGKEGKHLNSLEKCHIYFFSKDSLRMDESYIDTTQYSRPYRDFTPDSSTYHSPSSIMYKTKKKLNSVAFSPQANCTDQATATCWRS
jgi:hypothetical protein